MLNPGRHLVGPRHVAFDPSGRYAYAVDYYAASLSVLDTTTNHTVATAPPGGAVTVLDQRGHPRFVRNISTCYGRYGYLTDWRTSRFNDGVATTTSTG